MELKDYPTPQDLIAYLKGKRKAKGQYKDHAGGRCCLGHYADMCGIEYDSNENIAAFYVHLPSGHWLFDGGCTRSGTLAKNLALTNDATPGFGAVIEILKGVEL